MAFLSIFPEVEGMTIVIPKVHYDSYIFNIPTKVAYSLLDATKEVANILDHKLENVIRTKLVFEGLEVPHLHAKLLPMYKDMRPENSHPPKATDDQLQKVLQRLKK